MTRQAVKGVSWSFVGAAGQFVLQLVAIVVLSRLLSVAEYGTAVAASVVTGLAAMLGQQSIAPALVQAKRLDRSDVGTAVAISTVLGVVMAAVLVVAAPVLSRVVGLGDQPGYLRLLSVVLVLGGLSAVATGLLQRELRFRDFALVELGSYAVGYLGVSVPMALLGAGAVSLIWGQIGQAALLAVGAYALTRHELRPPGPALLVERGRRIVRFSGAYTLSQIGNWFAVNGDNLVVTSLLGPRQLGLYSRAYQLVVQPANLVGSVADRVLFPALARIQDDRERMARAFVLVNSLIALVTLPAGVLLCVLAPEVVAVVLGDKWGAVVLPLQVLAVVLLPRTAYKISGSLTRATGAVLGGAARQWIYAVEVVLGAWIGSHWGVPGVAVGASVAIVLHCATMLQFSARIRPHLVRDVLRGYAKSLPVAVVTLVAALPVSLWLRAELGDVAGLLGGGLAGVLAAAGTVWVLRRAFHEELQIVAAARRRRPAPAGSHP